MSQEDLEQLKYPVGYFQAPTESTTSTDIATWISDIENLPEQIEVAVTAWSDEQLDTPYRPDGWTVRQVIHHVADSHMNSYIRFKWTLTEDAPTIKAYDEKLWAELPEAKTAPIELSLNLLKSLHVRWVIVMKNLTAEDLKRKFTHPESGKTFDIQWLVALYSWHSRHHLAHITRLAERKKW